MRKTMMIALLGALPLTSTLAMAGQLVEIEGDEAKNIATKGNVLGVSIFDEDMKRELDVRMGFVYRVIHNDNFWTCFSWQDKTEEKWFCDSRQ